MERNHPVATAELLSQTISKVLLIQIKFPVSNIRKQNGEPVPLFSIRGVHNIIEPGIGTDEYTTKLRSTCKASQHGTDVVVCGAVHIAVEVTRPYPAA